MVWNQTRSFTKSGTNMIRHTCSRKMGIFCVWVGYSRSLWRIFTESKFLLCIVTMDKLHFTYMISVCKIFPWWYMGHNSLAHHPLCLQCTSPTTNRLTDLMHCLKKIARCIEYSHYASKTKFPLTRLGMAINEFSTCLIQTISKRIGFRQYGGTHPVIKESWTGLYRLWYLRTDMSHTHILYTNSLPSLVCVMSYSRSFTIIPTAYLQ